MRQVWHCQELPSSCLSVSASVLPNGTTRLPLDGFSWNLKLEYFSKNCRENSCLIRIEQEKRVLYMKTNIHFWSYLAQFFLEWEMFQTKFVEEIKTHILFSVTSFRKSCLLEIMLKNIVENGRPQMTILRIRTACCIPKATNTHSKYIIITAFPLQQWLHERASTYVYTYIACLVHFTFSDVLQ